MADKPRKYFQKWNETKAVTSPVEGVDMLREGNSNNFITVKNQLHDKLQSEYGNLASFIETGNRWQPEEPDIDELQEKYSHVTQKIRESIMTSKFTEYEKLLSKTESDYSKIFGTLKRVMNDTVRDKVERSEGFSEAKEQNDPVALWKIMKHVIGMQTAMGDTSDAKQTVKLLYQADRMSTSESLLSFYHRLKLRYENCELLEVKDIPDQQGAARDFYSKLDEGRYGNFYRDKRNNTKRGIDKWPTTLQEAYEEVEAWLPPTWKSNDSRPGRPAVFSAMSEPNQEYDARKQKPCFQCGKLGHWRDKCPDRKQKQNAMVVKGDEHPKSKNQRKDKQKNAKAKVMFADVDDAADREDYNIFNMHSIFNTHSNEENDKLTLNEYEMIYDTGADTLVVKSKKLVLSLRKNEKPIFVSGVGGERECNEVGIFPCFGNAIFTPDCSVNIMSSHVAEDKFTVTHNVGVDFTVHVSDDIKLVFDKRSNGFYVCNLSQHMEALKRLHNRQLGVYTVTVHDREINYSKREIKAAEASRELQRALGYPSSRELIQSLRSGNFVNCPITPEDVQRADNIFGENVAILKGKSTDPGPSRFNEIKVPKSSRQEQDMNVDVMYVKEVPLLISVFKPLNLLMATELTVKRDTELVAKSIMSQINKMRANAFEVKRVIVDGERPVMNTRELLAPEGIEMIQVAAGAHVVVTERAIRVIKERVRCIIAELPWKLPKCLCKWIVYYAVSRINAMPRASSSVGISAREEFTGIKLDYNNELTVCFGDYVQAYRTPAVKRSLDARTHGAIALIPMDNLTGSWVFMDLITNRTFTATKWKVLPTPDIVIQRIRQLGDGPLTKPDDSMPDLIDITDVRVEDAVPMDDREPLRDVAPRHITSTVDMSDEDTEPNEEPESESDPVQIDNDAEPEQHIEPKIRRSPRLNTYVVSGNMSISKAKREHGTVADEAVLSEIAQLMEKGVLEVVEPAQAKGNQILYSHIFLKEKRDQSGKLIKVKGRLVAGGDKQDRQVYTVERRTSPTIHTESLFMLISLAASKHMDLASIDIEGAFLEPVLDDVVYMYLDKDMSDIVVKARPELARFRNYKGQLVTKLLRALYGLVQASRLWYILLSETLMSFGFKRSKIDKCIFYGRLLGYLMFIGVHVDDMGVLYEHMAGVRELERLLNTRFNKANVDTSNPLDFLGMRLTTTEDAIFADMKRFVKESCDSWGTTSPVSTPATTELFQVDETSPLLSEPKAKAHHTGAAKLLYVSKRTRPDVLTAVSACCGRVISPTEQDWCKLDRVFRYLHGTPDLGLKFVKGRPLKLNCFCDAAFACHTDYKSRTGVVIMCNSAPVATKSSKQTMTTKSTPECELVSLSDGATMTLGCAQLYEELEVPVGTCTIYEDNKAVLEYIAHGGPIHARTRYIGVKLYFTKEHVDSGELEVIWCKSEDMIADLMTKPVVGALFIKLRDQIVFVVPVVE